MSNESSEAVWTITNQIDELVLGMSLVTRKS